MGEWVALFKRLFFGLLLSMSVLSPLTEINAESEEEINVGAKRAVAIDVYDGSVLFEKNGDEVAYPASITKVMTAILLSEKINDDEKIKISEKVSLTEASNNQVILEEGEEISKKDALAMMMMISANDVAHAVAEHISGNDEEFAKLMNEKAKELGAKKTSFQNPSGLPNSEHKTTANDMALIIRDVKNHPDVVKAMQTKNYKLKTNKREVEIEKTHSIYEHNENAVGGKTGWTVDSGNTLVEYSKKGKKEVATVILGADGSDMSYKDTNTLLDYSFKKIDPKMYFKKGELVTTLNDGEKKINLFAKDDVTITQKGRERVQNNISLKKIQNYEEGEVIGQLNIIDDNGVVESVFELYSDKDIKSVKQMESDFSPIKAFEEQMKNNGSFNKVFQFVILPSIVIFFTLVIIGKLFGGKRRISKSKYDFR